MNRILIPIDFSENADRALSAAKIMADKESTQLLVLHAYQPYIEDVTGTSGTGLPGIGSPDFFSVTNELENEFRHRLDQYTDALTAEGYNAEAIWSAGSVQSSVEQSITEYNPDLIVMGRTGTGGFLDKLIGSSATHIALHSPCPVMIIPPQSTPESFKKIVYATQFEYDENDVLKEVYVLMNHLGSKLTLLKINTDSQMNVQSDDQYIASIKNEFAITDESIVIRTAKHVLDGIEEYCDEIGADLLIMSARERSFLEEFLINPGVTKKLVVDTHIPLLVFHLKK